MKKILVFVILLFLLPSAFAIGISYKSGYLAPITYHPNSEVERTYYAIASGEAAVGVGGEFAKYAEYERLVKGPGPLISINIKFKFPNKRYKPGIYSGDVTVSEVKAGGTGQFALLAAARVPFYVRVLDPDKYLEATSLRIEPKHVSAGEKIIFVISGVNYGEKKIENAKEVVAIYYDNALIKTLASKGQSIESEEGIELKVEWDTEKKKIGEYKAVAKIVYDGKETSTKEDVFYVGDEKIIVRNYTRQITNDSINRFSLEVLSQWNAPVDFSAGISLIKEGKELGYFKTPNEVLEQWKPKIIDSFIDTRGFALGKYQVNITSFAGTKKASVYQGTVTVVEGKPNVIVQKVEAPTQIPKEFILVLVAVVVLLVVLNVILIIVYGRNRKKRRR